jgi:hypothetical protein
LVPKNGRRPLSNRFWWPSTRRCSAFSELSPCPRPGSLGQYRSGGRRLAGPPWIA